MTGIAKAAQERYGYTDEQIKQCGSLKSLSNRSVVTASVTRLCYNNL